MAIAERMMGHPVSTVNLSKQIKSKYILGCMKACYDIPHLELPVQVRAHSPMAQTDSVVPL